MIFVKYIEIELFVFYSPDLGGFSAFLILSSFQLNKFVPITSLAPKV